MPQKSPEDVWALAPEGRSFRIGVIRQLRRKEQSNSSNRNWLLWLTERTADRDDQANGGGQGAAIQNSVAADLNHPEENREHQVRSIGAKTQYRSWPQGKQAGSRKHYVR